MLYEFIVPVVTLLSCTVGAIAGLDRLCLFHQTYQSAVARLESERWLLDQCSDPHFFSKMHQHSDLCFQVENNARVGAFMLALRQLTQSFLLPDALSALATAVTRCSWPILAFAGACLLFAPSWLARTAISYRGPPRWPECADTHFKNA
jgi:hypothetical protein